MFHIITIPCCRTMLYIVRSLRSRQQGQRLNMFIHVTRRAITGLASAATAAAAELVQRRFSMRYQQPLRHVIVRIIVPLSRRFHYNIVIALGC